MLNYAEIASSRTIVPLPIISSPSHAQQETAHSISSVPPYAIGPIDPAQFTTLHIHLPTGATYPLLLPLHLPRLILNDPAFQDGSRSNCLSEEEQTDNEDCWMSSVTSVVNHVYTSLTDIRLDWDTDTGEVAADFLPWQTGWVLRDLTRLAERDTTLAAVGMAHLCMLLPLLREEHPENGLYAGRCEALYLHTWAVKAYRAQVRVYRAQGKSFDEAQRLALAGNL